VNDLVDTVVGDPAIAALRRQRQDFVRYTQGSHDALIAPAEPGGVSLHERAAIALRVATIERDAALTAHYQAQLKRAGGEPSPRLAKILEHVSLIAQSPGSATHERVDALRGAGLAPRDVVVVTQIVAFASYQIRVVAGLRALSGELHA
jgi:uncharacterized protein YciW